MVNLGPASTSSVVAELYDRQRWDLSDNSRQVAKPWSIFSNLNITVAGALPPVDHVDLPENDLAEALITSFFYSLSPVYVTRYTHNQISMLIMI